MNVPDESPASEATDDSRAKAVNADVQKRGEVPGQISPTCTPNTAEGGQTAFLLTSEELAVFIQSRRAQLLAYIQHNIGPALRKKLEPEDVLQEISLTAMGTLSAFHVPGREPFKLLCQMAEQKIIDAHRHHFAAQKRSADREVSLDTPLLAHAGEGFINMLVASMTSPSQAFSRGQKELRLQEALDRLSDDQRELLKLRFIDGLPTKEIADRLHRSDGAVRVLLTRTLSSLQEILTDSC